MIYKENNILFPICAMNFTAEEWYEIYEDANWLLHMVENLLSVTRITDGISNTLKETPEVAEEVLFDAVSTIRKRYPDYQIQVSVPGDFYVVPMDPLLIKQVIINLLENAYFHARSEQPVQCYLTGDDAQIQVHIRDHGNGIAPDRLKSIFDAAPSAPSSAANKLSAYSQPLTSQIFLDG